eukprot:5972168-Alexandrium_andersonii.AAC.1
MALLQRQIDELRAQQQANAPQASMGVAAPVTPTGPGTHTPVVQSPDARSEGVGVAEIAAGGVAEAIACPVPEGDD